MTDNNDLLKLIDSLSLKDTINLNEIPDLDLYMDQVITLFENKLSNGKRFDDDKLLTKTMINNYAKDKLLQPITNKKYSRENILLLILIYNLKQSLSISDIKTLLYEIKDTNDDLIQFYNSFLNRTNSDFIDFKNEISTVINENDAPDNLPLFILSLINKSNMYKKLAINLLDNNINKKDTPQK
ncbi:MAG: DUF1836 domain-containing protein [Inconstantimicrobium porci]|uniref:DUF1836 domain-containing protein n=1 Tax=Inconstantimicrobium porci TaxID=2652291 RepID=A0A7X2MX02_9CLOT|nr:DUF1836 domain-containing protein [Inconstantimicrobium porci]MDD6771198.1 DUF1836 domain-containing protein [Inconstantimicrobium porci]MDY5910721.1 DUF1836 domain-containing protein [Inconstantimicrobium porci]MSR90638.1 DUF1836 domain-containing protein [Inconstantimicrobium porci]